MRASDLFSLLPSLLACGLVAAAIVAPQAGAATIIHTLSGNPVPQNSGGFNEPGGIAALPGGGALIANDGAHDVVEVTPSGDQVVVAGTGTYGEPQDGQLATGQPLRSPHDVSPLPGGGFLIADSGNNAIYKVDADGIITRVAGMGPAGGSLFGGDGGPATSAALGRPTAVEALSGGAFLFVDHTHNRVRMVDAEGNISTVAGSAPPAVGQDSDPDTQGGLTGDGGPATDAQMQGPVDISLTPDGGYLIADANNCRIREVDNTGTISTVAGSADCPTQPVACSPYNGEGGPATAATLCLGPTWVAADASGGFYISENSEQTIRYVAPDGTITTPIGTGVQGGWDGEGCPPDVVPLDYPTGIAVPPDGGGLMLMDYSLIQDGAILRQLVDAPIDCHRIGYTGTAGNDAFDGSVYREVMGGKDGSDTLRGQNGPDTLIGDAGNDQLVGGNGNDQLQGGNNNDSLIGGANNDQLVGGTGADTLTGGPGADALSGGDGADTLNADDGTRDTVNCGPGSDRANVDAKDQTSASCERVF